MSEGMEPMGETVLNAMTWASVSYHDETVVIASSGQTVSLRCGDAVKVCDWLLRHRAFLRDRAQNYYDCRECGSMHHRMVQVCPTLVVCAGE